MREDNEYNDYFDDTADDEAQGQSSIVSGQGTEVTENHGGQDERRPEGGRRGNWLRKAVAVLVTVAVVTVALWAWVIYWVPYVIEAQERGVIVELRKEGLIFDTYEGQMVTDQRLAGAAYKRDFLFSVEDDSLAHEIMELKFTGKMVTLTYKEYRGALPWRGKSKIIVTDCKVQ